MDLDSMKYADLRSLAKELGLKANMKADKLLKAIKQHYQQAKKEEVGQGQNNNNVQENENMVQESHDEACKEEASGTAVFVNTRRGRGNGTKRKVSAAVTEYAAQMAPKTTEDDTVMNARNTPSNAGGPKRRKVSSNKDSEKTDSEPPTSSEHPQPNVEDEAPVHSETEKAPKMTKAGRIPRYQRLQSNKTLLKPTTPNFKKLHEAQFNKMESIDTYVQRKTKHLDTYKGPVKEQKDLSNKTKPQPLDVKAQVKMNPAATLMFSPAPLFKRPADERRGHALLSASKAPPNKLAGKDVPFRPSVLSTRRINVRFSEATRDNEFKTSLVKTPARKSPSMTSSTPQKQTADAGKRHSVRTSTFSAQKTPGAFVFTGNTSVSTTPGTQKKPSFDLKASLSRPLAYKPHKGKLKPFGDAKENTSENKSVTSNAHQDNYKQRKVQSREDRRTKQVEDRKQKKQSLLGARRGLVMM
ncbi:nucleolar and spindle-associated protein 1 [Odontesthes bonariensis]|uniref:nucleolar and spindle-associated protein 1 n=1 Tax=Odontesthes bonariensis TaxID=219752 RepID=UPI003F58D85A